MAAKKGTKKVKAKATTKPKRVKDPVKGRIAKEVNPIGNKISKLGSPKSPFKQNEFFNVLAEQSSLSKKDVKAVIESLKAIAKVHLKRGGPGQFTLPGLLKITSITKLATKARKGRNPFTGEDITIKAKPARKVIKVKALKKFKAEIE